MSRLTCFKAYDIRGKLGEELNEEIAWRVGRAYAQHLRARRVAVGGDVRLSSPSLKRALAKGVMDAGADVIDIGVTGAEEVYFAAFHLDLDGGVEVTASHNPVDHNGMKFVGRGALPISGDSGLQEIQHIAETQDFVPPVATGSFTEASILHEYIAHLLGYINPAALQPLKLVVNAGNGAAGHVIDAIEECFKALGTPVEFIKIRHDPDGAFPNGVPNPLLPENRAATADEVKACGADMGIAWDGDFDRCFLFDEQGNFIESYYIVGLLAEALLKKCPGGKIIHDPRLIWNTVEKVKRAGGVPIQSKTGHAFIKERMRKENAVYGGEMSGHHYFREFAYCDSGMIPWLLIIELLGVTGKSLSALAGESMAAYPCSGEINYHADDIPAVLARIRARYAALNPAEEKIDGLSLAFPDWRFNLRAANTEPLLRLNIETRGDRTALKKRLAEIEAVIKENSPHP